MDPGEKIMHEPLRDPIGLMETLDEQATEDSRPPDMGSVVNDTFSPDGASEHRQICLKAAILPSNPAKNVYHGIFWRNLTAIIHLFHWNQAVASLPPRPMSGGLDSQQRREPEAPIRIRRTGGGAGPEPRTHHRR
jgi:hypothetical protein